MITERQQLALGKIQMKAYVVNGDAHVLASIEAPSDVKESEIAFIVLELFSQTATNLNYLLWFEESNLKGN